MWSGVKHFISHFFIVCHSSWSRSLIPMWTIFYGFSLLVSHSNPGICLSLTPIKWERGIPWYPGYELLEASIRSPWASTQITFKSEYLPNSPWMVPVAIEWSPPTVRRISSSFKSLIISLTLLFSFCSEESKIWRLLMWVLKRFSPST